MTLAPPTAEKRSIAAVFARQGFVVVNRMAPPPMVQVVRDHLEARVPLNLRPGDALLYRGIELTHWREPFAGESMAQVFLHYVDQAGPHAGEKFDRRPALATPYGARAPVKS